MTINDLSELIQDDLICILDERVPPDVINWVCDAVVKRINEYKMDMRP